MMTERFLFACAALSLVACTGTRINGKVASCADQAPIDGARISVTENSAVDGTSALPTKNDAGPGAAPSTSDKDGSFKIDVVSGDAASYRVKAEKSGFLPGEADASAKTPAIICMTPSPAAATRPAAK